MSVTPEGRPGHDERGDRGRPREEAQDDRLADGGRPADDRQPVAEATAEVQDPRHSFGEDRDALDAGQSVAGHRDHQSQDQHAHEDRPEHDRRRGHAPDAEDHHATAASATTITVSTMRSTTTVRARSVRLMPSPSPSAWLRTSSPSRAGRTLFAR